MEWGINDSLKSKAYGHKKEADINNKIEKIENYEKMGGHYYPMDRQGKFDEWGALVKHLSARDQDLRKKEHE